MDPVVFQFEGRAPFMISGGLWVVLQSKLEAADLRDSGRAMRQLLEFLRGGLQLSDKQAMLLCGQLRPSVDCERFRELAFLADLVEVTE